MDLKVMPISHKGHKFILCIIDEVTNYLITIPIYQAKSEEIQVLIENILTKYLHSRIYNHGSRQCIYVFTYDLLIK